MSVGNFHMLLSNVMLNTSGEVEFLSLNGTSGLSDSWTVPAGVFAISVALIGGGGGGAAGARQNAGGAGGGGGGLSFANDLPVEPGDTISILVGGGGAGGDYSNSTNTAGTSGFSGGNSYVRKTGVWEIVAGGGGRGSSAVFDDFETQWYSGAGGSGGTSNVGGTGGLGGSTAQSFSGNGRFINDGGSGGGAGGWDGIGGRGRGLDRTASTTVILSATLGVNGGGAGGGDTGGSATGAYGNFASWPYQGTGGGIITNTNTPPYPEAAGAGGPGSEEGRGADGQPGRAGRIRIMWNSPNDNRSYPLG